LGWGTLLVDEQGRKDIVDQLFINFGERVRGHQILFDHIFFIFLFSIQNFIEFRAGMGFYAKI